MIGAELTDASRDEFERSVRIGRVTGQRRSDEWDIVSVEEPLEIRLVFGPLGKRRSKSLSITMRTPGNDFELAAGFLLSESIITRADQILGFEYVGRETDADGGRNRLVVELHHNVSFDVSLLQRHFYTTSSCGICGKASLEAVRAQGVHRLTDSFEIDWDVIFGCPASLRACQSGFDRTGGIHAAGLMDETGRVQVVREDVGRHNAVDKLIGSQILDGHFPLSNRIIIVSGRASFELLQKALMASIPILVAVGAPSSLAVEVAIEFNMTLIGFTSDHRFNVYAGQERLRGMPECGIE